MRMGTSKSNMSAPTELWMSRVCSAWQPAIKRQQAAGGNEESSAGLGHTRHLRQHAACNRARRHQQSLQQWRDICPAMGKGVRRRLLLKLCAKQIRSCQRHNDVNACTAIKLPVPSCKLPVASCRNGNSTATFRCRQLHKVTVVVVALAGAVQPKPPNWQAAAVATNVANATAKETVAKNRQQPQETIKFRCAMSWGVAQIHRQTPHTYTCTNRAFALF